MVAKEFSFGFLARTLVGALAGGLSGAFLQTIVATMVMETGNPMGPTPAKRREWISRLKVDGHSLADHTQSPGNPNARCKSWKMSRGKDETKQITKRCVMWRV